MCAGVGSRLHYSSHGLYRFRRLQLYAPELTRYTSEITAIPCRENLAPPQEPARSIAVQEPLYRQRPEFNSTGRYMFADYSVCSGGLSQRRPARHLNAPA